VLPELPDMEKIKTLADEVTNNMKFGWDEIDAIINHLRSNFIHDRKELVSDLAKIDNGEIPCAEFLFKTKRGPDYQFATAAILMLRSQGYAARLVSGFYAAPENYNPKSRHTEILVKDTHFWVEIYLGGGIWATLEPTPGYEILGPPPTTFQKFYLALYQVRIFIQQQFFLLSILIGSSSLFYLYHRRLLNIYETYEWQFKNHKTLRQFILGSQKLLYQRLNIFDLSPNNSETLSQWLKRMPLEESSRNKLVSFSKLIDWARYAPVQFKEPPHLTTEATKQLLADIITEWSTSKIQALKKSLIHQAKKDTTEEINTLPAYARN
jgi:hypothetical protein